MTMRTTVTLEPEVVEKLRREMRRSGKSFKATLNDALRDGLARRKEAAGVEPFVVRPSEMGLRPGLDYSNVAELLEVAEGPDHR